MQLDKNSYHQDCPTSTYNCLEESIKQLKKLKLSETSQNTSAKLINERKRRKMNENVEDGEKPFKLKKSENSIKTTDFLSNSFKVFNKKRKAKESVDVIANKKLQSLCEKHVQDKREHLTKLIINKPKTESSKNNETTTGKDADFKDNINPYANNCQNRRLLHKEINSKSCPKKIRPYKRPSQFVVESSNSKMLKFENCEKYYPNTYVQTVSVKADNPKLCDETLKLNKNSVPIKTPHGTFTNCVPTKNKEAKLEERKISEPKYYEGLEYLDYDSDALVIDLSSEE